MTAFLPRLGQDFDCACGGFEKRCRTRKRGSHAYSVEVGKRGPRGPRRRGRRGSIACGTLDLAASPEKKRWKKLQLHLQRTTNEARHPPPPKTAAIVSKHVAWGVWACVFALFYWGWRGIGSLVLAFPWSLPQNQSGRSRDTRTWVSSLPAYATYATYATLAGPRREGIWGTARPGYGVEEPLTLSLIHI